MFYADVPACKKKDKTGPRSDLTNKRAEAKQGGKLVEKQNVQTDFLARSLSGFYRVYVNIQLK